MLSTLLKAAIPKTPDIILGDTIKVEKLPVKSTVSRVQPIDNINSVMNDLEAVQMEPKKFISLRELASDKNIGVKLENSTGGVQRLPNSVKVIPKAELGTVNGINLTELATFTPLQQLIEDNSIGIEGEWRNNLAVVEEPPNNTRLFPNTKYRFNPELPQIMPYENVNPSTRYDNRTGYWVTVNTQGNEDYNSVEEKAVVITNEKVYHIDRNITTTKGADGNLNVCIKGKVTINARYVGHSSTTVSAPEEIKFIIESPALEVNQLYIEENEEKKEEKNDWENILDIYKNSFKEGWSHFNIGLILLNAEVRSIKYLLDKYFPALGETTEKWRKQKDEFFENSLETMRQVYTEHPELGNDFQKILVGMEIDETNLNPLEKAKLAEAAIRAGIVKDVASGANGIIDILFSPLETLDALTSPNAGEMIWEGLTEDIVNDWEKGTVQGRSQAAGRVVSMLIPIEGVKAAGTAGKAGKTSGVLTKLKRVGSRSGTGVEISKPVKKMDIKKVEFPKTPVKYGDHYRYVNRKKTLKPDIVYTDGNNYKYTTDAQGRISRVEGELKLQKGERNFNAQKTVGGNDRLLTDDGGHLIASRFGGSGEIDNLVPQSKHINRSGREWYKMEQEWAKALKEGKKVEVDIQPIYNGTSVRPDSFSIRYKIDGKETIRKMVNPTGP